jgi:uncharacterized protein (TIGR00297 family)
MGFDSCSVRIRNKGVRGLIFKSHQIAGHRLTQGTGNDRVMRFDHSGVLPAAVVAIGFALLARGLRAVTEGGALVGALIAFLLMKAAGLSAFYPLIAVFVLTLLATRWRADRKRNLGVAERGSGRRASQVLANLGAAGLCAVAASLYPRESATLMTGAMAVLAEAASDTVASEVGQAVASQPRLIIGFRSVPVGTNGGISLVGTTGGFIAACVVAWTGTLFGVVPWRWAPIVAAAGTVGMLFDSVLGAALENREKMGNDSVNFVSTVFAADLALLAVVVLETARR